MCEIDITDFIKGEDPSEYSASAAELGQNAGRITWNNAKREASHKPLLNAPGELDAMRYWMKDSGAWDEAERDAMTDEELNALFIQLISGDIREMGLDKCDIEDFDWEEYQEHASQGSVSGNIYQSSDRIYFYLGS
jgi:hypothetical protein